jgi:hypothetical protein
MKFAASPLQETCWPSKLKITQQLQGITEAEHHHTLLQHHAVEINPYAPHPVLRLQQHCTLAEHKQQRAEKPTAVAHLTPLPHSSSSSYASALVGHILSASSTSAMFDLLLLLRPDRLGQVASDPRLFD